MSREEKVKELHRAELRRKVAAWLPDYQPRNFGQDQYQPIDALSHILSRHGCILSFELS